MGKRLIVNADDFGRSRSINQAVIQAHREGILTTASLMTGGEALEEAVELARQHPRLGVGLHLTLVCGRAVSAPSEVPGLVRPDGRFDDNPVRAGLRFFLDWRLRESLRQEVRAQFDAFRRTGLELDHVNGHLHLHLHPTILAILDRDAARFGIRRLRLTRDPLRLNLELARGQLGYRLSHALVFGLLSRRARRVCGRHGWRHTDRVFGLLQNARVDEAYVAGLLPRLPEGDSELYSHPSVDEFRPELEALLSPMVRRLVDAEGIRLIRYQDL